MNADENTERYARVRELMDVVGAARCRITALGVGRVGASTLEQLVRHGVGTEPPGRIRMFDDDVVDWPNLIGTPYREAHAREATPKVEALAQVLRDIHSEVNLSYAAEKITEANLPTFIQIAGDSDLLLLSADNAPLMLKIADACHDRCPTIMALLGPKCDHAEIAFSLPGQTPPLAKTLGQRPRRRINGAQALGCDVSFCTSFLAALCLRLLLGDSKGSDIVPCFADAPLYVLGLRPSRFLFRTAPRDQVRSIVLIEAASLAAP